ncbi:hypothetical protein DSECCO2_543880 [anaerobic digester metagenome]
MPHPNSEATGPAPAYSPARKSASSRDTPHHRSSSSPPPSRSARNPGRSRQAASTSGGTPLRRSTSRSTAAARKRSLPGRMRTKRSVNPSAVSAPGAMVVTGTPALRSCRTMAAVCTEPRFRSRPQLTRADVCRMSVMSLWRRAPKSSTQAVMPASSHREPCRPEAPRARKKRVERNLTTPRLPAPRTCRMERGSSRYRAILRAQRSRASSQPMSRHTPSTFRRGERRRWGLASLRRCTSSLGQAKPRVKGWSGLPRRRSPPGPFSATMEQASGQSRVQAVMVMYSPQEPGTYGHLCMFTRSSGVVLIPALTEAKAGGKVGPCRTF